MNYKKALQQEILSRIDFSGYDIQPANTDADKIIHLVVTARSEVGHEFQRNGQQAGLAYWLSGLPSCIDLPIYCNEQIDFAVKIGSIPANYTEKQADRVCENFYNFMAANILQMYFKAEKQLAKA